MTDPTTDKRSRGKTINPNVSGRVYAYLRDHPGQDIATATLDRNLGFTPPPGRDGRSSTVAGSSLSYMVRHPDKFPGITRVGTGVYRYDAPLGIGHVLAEPGYRNEPLPTLTHPPEPEHEPPTLADVDYRLVRVLDEVAGRLLVIDDDTTNIYWMEPLR